jgi:CheY-like chemotaxis protein
MNQNGKLVHLKQGCLMKKNPNKVCILLVEDDESIRLTMQMVLESEPDFEVHTAEDGKVALTMVAASKVLPDIIITDLMMPNVTGWELVDTIRRLERTHAIPIIVYSGVAHYAQGNPYLEGCYFIRKPVELDTLFSAIRTALGNPYNHAPKEATNGTSQRMGA